MNKNKKKETDSFKELAIKSKKDEYNLEELANILGTSIYTLRRRINDGRLKASKIFGEYRVTQEQLSDFLIREKQGKSLEYFSKKGFLYKKECKDESRLLEESIYLVEEAKVLALTDAARIYYEKGLNNRKEE